uniref:DNA-directed RNA polymerase subunit alpha C-terminal domain-containing protein n=1 Tax=Actinoplanes sp. CA-151224 TaxID=3239904 RepID=UPI003F49AAFA
MTGPIHALVHGAPIHQGIDRPVTFPTLPAALDWVLATLARHNRASARFWTESGPYRTVTLVPVREAEMLLVAARYEGEGENRRQVPDPGAHQVVARLLPAHGYREVVLPEPGTPLHTLAPRLPSRVINCLLREGYTTVEQVAAVPDVALHDIRSLGVKGIGELRAASAGGTPAPAVTVVLTSEQADAVAGLLAALGELARAHGRPDLAEQAAAVQRDLLT